MDKIDYKKEYKDLYLPKQAPVKIIVPSMNFIMVDGKGSPNQEDGEYKKAMQLLYALTFTIKMSKMSGMTPAGYFEYVVPPLEGLWWLNDNQNIDFKNKDLYCWTSMIRQPEFVNEDVFLWACSEVEKKRPDIDITKARFETFTEGLCVQVMHIGPYDEEPITIAKVNAYINEQGLATDIGNEQSDGSIRRHHEIYISNPLKAKPENLKTVLRFPVRKLK